MSRLLHGKNVDSIENSMLHIIRELNELKSYQTESEQTFEEVNKRLAKSLSGFSVLRFNPFKGTGSGGNQSFASAFLNDHGDGIVFSSLYSRDRVSIFSKAVCNYQSEFELSSEEKEAIRQAREKLSK